MFRWKFKSSKLKNVPVIITGPTGVGKGTLKKFLIKWFGFHVPVSDTSRPMRPEDNEVDGVTYHFISPDEFRKRIKEGYYVEWSGHYDELYGTPKNECNLKNRSLIFEVDPINGARALAKAFPDAVTIYLKPPGKTIIEQIEKLRERIIKRGGMTEEKRERRLKRYPEEAKFEHEADVVVVNESGAVSICLAKICMAIYKKMGGIGIAIDGYASRGKGTIAKWIAEKFDAFYLDSGAVYRYITYKLAIEKGITLDDENLEQHLIKLVDAFTPAEFERYKVELRSPEVNAVVSKWAETKVVRGQAKLIQLGLVFGSGKTMFVADGRDMTTVLFTGSFLCLFIDGVSALCAQWRAK
jgi:guanylate kinase